jgi:hypothetical protein
MFFPSASEKLEDINLSAFYLVNFQTSRPDDIIWTTEGPDPNADSRHHHPDYVSEESIGTDQFLSENAILLTCSEVENRFCKAYDIYSLGILLLEIAAWKPIKLFHERHAGESPHAFRRILLDKYVPKLAKEVG